MTKKWLSKAENCELCLKPLEGKEYFVDGDTSFGGWALMCPACFEKYGKGLGLGCGQKYDAVTKEQI